MVYIYNNSNSLYGIIVFVYDIYIMVWFMINYGLYGFTNGHIAIPIRMKVDAFIGVAGVMLLMSYVDERERQGGREGGREAGRETE